MKRLDPSQHKTVIDIQNEMAEKEKVKEEEEEDSSDESEDEGVHSGSVSNG